MSTPDWNCTGKAVEGRLSRLKILAAAYEANGGEA